MNRKHQLLIALCAVWLGSACATSNPPGIASSGKAVIRGVKGTAEIARIDSGWQRARPGIEVASGHRARTSENSFLDIDLGQYGGVLKLMPNSFLEFERIGSGSAPDEVVAVLNLVEGRIVGDTLDLPAPQQIEIKTRGGKFVFPKR